ncbi:MAG: hypothetical protein HOW73_15830 [Polyangiaceae bacterium]|nr:hypothetical protein [Polyangiaceae bacterium]
MNASNDTALCQRTPLLKAVARSRRLEAPYDVVGTAAGDDRAVAVSLMMLSTRSLDGVDIPPMEGLVSAHVEALAAWSSNAIVRLTSAWREPRDCLRMPAWVAAWKTAARHLHQAGRLSRRDLDHEAFRDEVAVLWPGESLQPLRFALLAQDGCALSHSEARLLAGAGLSDTKIEAPSVARAEPSLFRLLRGKTAALSEEARAVLVGRLLAWQRMDPIAAAMLVELVDAFDPDAVDEIRVDVAFALQAGGAVPPPFAYVLMTSWRIP